MKPFYQIIFWLLSMFSLTFAACRKPSTETPPPVTRNLLLQQTRKGNLITKFEYDVAGNLVSLTDSAAGNTIASTTRFEYAGGKLAKATYGYMNYRFFYPDENTVVVETGSAYNPVLEREVYSYRGSQLLNYTKYYYQTATVLVPEVRITFMYDAAGNVVKEEEEGYDMYDGKWLFVRTTTSTYDTMHNTHFAIENRRYADLARKTQSVKNNPLQREHRNKNGTIYRTEKFIYEYNAAGQKIKQVEEVWAGGRLVSKDTTSCSYW